MKSNYLMSLDNFYPHLVQMLQIYLYYCEPTNYFNKGLKLRTINSEQDRNAIITAALLCIDKCLDLNSFLSAIVTVASRIMCKSISLVKQISS